jgi:hypothetical protein
MGARSVRERQGERGHRAFVEEARPGVVSGSPFFVLLSIFLGAGCGSFPVPSLVDGGAVDGGAVADAGTSPDGGTVVDGGGLSDGGVGPDGGGGGLSDGGVGSDGGGVGDGGAPQDIRVRLSQIPGLTVRDGTTDVPGYRFFTLTLTQPVDHAAPNGASFPLRMTLLHRADDAPMVLYTSGYFVSSRGARVELARLLNANQLSIEHRYFATSIPNPIAWEHLTVAQAASDFHRAITLFKTIYRGRWISTGGSKGGDTVVFHRRFFPDDVDGTVAYVAPINFARDVEPTADNRTIVFLQNVGTSPSCRDALRAAQRAILSRRTAMQDRMRSAALAAQTSFDTVLGIDRAFEFAATELPFLFWQYGSQADCADVPASTAGDDALFDFFDGVSDVLTFSDADVLAFLPYYHQSATELGWVIDDESHVADLLLHPASDRPRSYLPADVPAMPYSESTMLGVQTWVATEGRGLLFLYGEYDPWTATAFDLGGARDSLRLVVPAGNHLSRLAQLSSADRTLAFDAIERWSGVRPQLTMGKPGAAPPEIDLMVEDLRRGARARATSERPAARPRR